MSGKNYPLIFLVEDNIAFSKVVEQHLKYQNYTNVRLFISGEECLKYLYLRPDIVIQDYQLQGISGLNVLKRTKKLLPHTEFIFLSGMDSVDIAVDTMKSGAYGYIVKNEVALQRLLQKINNIVRLQQQKKHNHRQKILIMGFVGLIIIIICLILLGFLHFY